MRKISASRAIDSRPMPPDPVSELADAVRTAISAVGGEASDEVPLERPPNPELGDYSTNAALRLSSQLGRRRARSPNSFRRSSKRALGPRPGVSRWPGLGS